MSINEAFLAIFVLIGCKAILAINATCKCCSSGQVIRQRMIFVKDSLGSPNSGKTHSFKWSVHPFIS